jgi:hypothetical protein
MILLGMVLGALCADFVKQYLWAFVAIGILLVIRPTVWYYSDGD